MPPSPALRRNRVPVALGLLLGLLLAVHALVMALRPVQPAASRSLGALPSAQALHALAMGDDAFLAQQLLLYMQAHDNQPGLSIPYASLDYGRIVLWWERALALDPKSQYAPFLAATLYSQVPDARRARTALDFVHRSFLQDPVERWRWLAHAAIVARHRLGDLALALRYAQDIALHAPHAPAWARQMHVFLLLDMGERERAAALLRALLDSGEIADPGEIRFLRQRLESLGPA